ncbi:MAG TPA: membrane protein insertion efficiency factor YidD [Deltaproteobacteria bacterium]|nr:membrane protein insertion efficiency factor YidD [Deltaproteobacteria bacterium]HQI81350.1 membrane protein insertion efficiency factor YidD [Deltaproteobacteria bacterium]
MGKTILITLIRLYQKVVSPLLAPACRFHPSCSEYAVQAITVYGPLRGLLKAAWRVLRCNPYSKGGFDPVEKTLGSIKNG